jgi:hypothetical protein
VLQAEPARPHAVSDDQTGERRPDRVIGHGPG